jgi:hypothetical protein
MSFEIKKASKKQSKLKLGLSGPSGSGKTWSALLILEGLGCKNVCVVDTERGSSELYSDRFSFDVIDFEPPYSPNRYIEVIEYVRRNGSYDALVIDSISPEWEGIGGCLEIHSKIPGQNSYTNWAKVTPLHQKFIEALLSFDKHLIVTTRAKTEYVMNKDSEGKTTITKMGLAPKQREGLDYELTSFFELDRDHNFIASKDRTGLFSADMHELLTADVGVKLKEWLDGGVEKEVEKKIVEPVEDKSIKEVDVPTETKEVTTRKDISKKVVEPTVEKTTTKKQSNGKNRNGNDDIKERATALLNACELVETIDGVNDCNTEFDAIKGKMPEKPLAQLQKKIDELNARYVQNVEVPF